jgi:putative resolvase
MKSKYPKHELIEDIGSGINLNRRGLKKIINLAIEGKVGEVVVAYKDRLCRFGYELIEDLIHRYSNGKIIIENKEEELAKDVLQIMNIFVAKMNGMRKYTKNNQKLNIKV